MASIFAIGALIHSCNSEPKPLFQETKKSYEYDQSGGVMTATYLVDTNKDGIADIRVHTGAAPRGRFYNERVPSSEEQVAFHSAYTNYSKRGIKDEIKR